VVRDIADLIMVWESSALERQKGDTSFTALKPLVEKKKRKKYET